MRRGPWISVAAACAMVLGILIVAHAGSAQQGSLAPHAQNFTLTVFPRHHQDGTTMKLSMNQVVRKSCWLWMGSHALRETYGKGNECILCSEAMGAAGSGME